ncbi:MAG: L,D-transpeptidase [Anaerolineales bacterium]|nr:L,D-transpeptidase [Anaerolineales bacterium]
MRRTLPPRGHFLLIILALLLVYTACTNIAETTSPPPIFTDTAAARPTRSKPTQTPTPDPTSPPTMGTTPNLTPTHTPTITTQAASWYHHPSAIWLSESYAHLTTPGRLIYTTLEDAIRGAGPTIHPPAGEVYLTYTTTQTVEGQTYYQLSPERWLGPLDLEPLTPSDFSGVLLSAPPESPFGWLLQDTWSQNGQGQALRQLRRYDLIKLSTPDPDEISLIEIGPDEYLPKNLVSLVTLRARPPEAARNCRWIEVDLALQTLQAYQDCALRFATLISSGSGEWYTPPGIYRVQYKIREHDLSNPPGVDQEYYIEKVPYLIYFSRPFALHAAYWHDAFGRPASSGCINLSPSDAAWLYDWALTGDPVLILGD